MKIFLPILFFGILAACARADSTPLLRAHAHNDYNHKRPLLEALDQKFCSVEADIHLTNGLLLVAHDLKDARSDRTLEALYLKPLRERILKNGGRVYRDGPSFALLIDLKTEPRAIYPVLRKLLEKYSDVLTKFTPQNIETNAITIILTGNRSVELVAAETNRLVACDGVLADLNSKWPFQLVPWISSEWKKSFTWNGSGEMPPEEKTKLRSLVFTAHREGRKIRFWGAPDKPEAWGELLNANVDLINTDKLVGLGKFLRATDSKQFTP
jgi:hypothetical protein